MRTHDLIIALKKALLDIDRLTVRAESDQLDFLIASARAITNEIERLAKDSLNN